MKNKDGLERNISKLSIHWDILKIEMKPFISEFKKAKLKKKPHEFVNLFVEAGRTPRLIPKDANYFMGHLFAIYFAVSLPLVIFSVFSIGYFLGLAWPL